MADNIFIKGVEQKYPKEVLQGRMRIEANVVACIFADICLTDEVKLTVKDFLTVDGRFYFALAKKIREAGFNTADEVTVLTVIGDNEELKDKYEERGGYQQINIMQEVIQPSNFDVYVDLLYRENTICSLYSDGFNIMNEVDINGKKIRPIDLFKKMDNAGVLEFYEMRLSTYGVSSSSKIMEEEELDITDDFIESCAEGEEMGVPFDCMGVDINGEDINAFPFMSRQCMGFLRGSLNMIGGYSSTGKSTLFITILLALIYRGEKCLIISNEQKSKAFKISVLCVLAVKHFRYYKLTKDKLLTGTFSEEDHKIIKQVQKLWRDEYKGKFTFISLTDPDINIVSKKTREYALQKGYTTVLYDTFKLENTSEDRYYMSLVEDTRTLDKLAKKYNLIFLASVQLAPSTKGVSFLTEQVLSNSKQLKENLEQLYLMRQTYPSELDKANRNYCHPFRLKKTPDGKWVEEPYELDPTGVYRTVFINKARLGSNSDDTGVAYIFKFTGAQSVFREIAQCRPVYGMLT